MEFIPAGEEEPHKVTISAGISTYPCMNDVEEDANTVIRYAEHALYNAKHRGKNNQTYSFFIFSWFCRAQQGWKNSILSGFIRGWNEPVET